MENLDKRELKGEELEKITGGYIYDTGEENEITGRRWLVIDEKGNIYKAYGSKAAAANASKGRGWSARQLTYEQWQKLKET